MSESKVTPIFGGPSPGEIDPKLIAQAEDFLRSVHAGEVRAFAIIYVRPNGHPSQSVKYEPETFYPLYGGVGATFGMLTDELKDNWTPIKHTISDPS